MASQEERDNYISLSLLLFRVGNQTLRQYFKRQWPIVYQRFKRGTVPPPWNDTPHDAAEMKKIQPSKLKFKFKDEETKFNSGNTNDWDFSLLTSVLRYSSLQFVLPSSPESKALDDLKKIRNRLIGHATDAAITNAVFNTAWADTCNALALFNASAADFKCVQDDVKKPLDVLYPMLKQCVEQEKEIKDSVDTIINRIEQLQQTVEKQHETLQQTVEQQHETQLEAARNIERKVDLVLSQGQQGQKRSAADVQPEEDVKTKKPRTTINNRERDYAKDSEMLKKAIKANTEYQTKYGYKALSGPQEQTKKVVREHLEKNENLISFCHIPLLSFLLCWCLEWRISHSGITENLPAKITDLYDEVAKVLVQKLHANLKYSEMPEKAKKIVKETLGKLAKLAASLLKKSTFDEEDMKKLGLTEDEIENLKVSGILHCVPGIRITVFQTKAEFSFTHLTLQEYLSASFFVKNNKIPENVSGQTFVFMCGLLSRKKDGERLMNKLIQQVTPKDYEDNVNKLLMVQCLYEYGEEELTAITINNMYDQYCSSDGVIGFDKVTDADVKYVSYLLDIIRSLKEQHPQSSSDYTLYIRGSPLTSFGVGVVCRSLVRNSFITKLDLSECSLDDKCVEKITDSLLNTGITYLIR